MHTNAVLRTHTVVFRATNSQQPERRCHRAFSLFSMIFPTQYSFPQLYSSSSCFPLFSICYIVNVTSVVVCVTLSVICLPCAHLNVCVTIVVVVVFSNIYFFRFFFFFSCCCFLLFFLFFFLFRISFFFFLFILFFFSICFFLLVMKLCLHQRHAFSVLSFFAGPSSVCETVFLYLTSFLCVN